MQKRQLAMPEASKNVFIVKQLRQHPNNTAFVLALAECVYVSVCLRCLLACGIVPECVADGGVPASMQCQTVKAN